MPEEEKKEKKGDDDKIILQVDMHCEGCKAKVRKALKEFKGVEGLDINLKDEKVTIMGKLDARKVYETVKKKSGKRTVLLYPDLKKEDEKKIKEEPKKEEQQPPPDPELVVVLKVNMHCGACAKQIKRSLLKMDGVNDVNEDVANCIVNVKGRNIDATKLCERVKKRSGKHCEIVPPPPKEEEKKEEKPAGEAKKDEEKPAEAAAAAAAEPEKKEGGEEKKEEKGEEKKEEKKETAETKGEIKKYEYMPHRSVPEYVYPPQLFSDENPNACSIM